MAAVIPEAAGAVTEGTSAVRGASAARRAPRASQGRGGSLAGQVPQRGKRAGRQALRARVPGGRNYQPVILAEFLLAVLVVALAPVAKGGTDTAKAKGGASPYDTSSMKQLLVIGLVYFILAVVSSGKQAGRIAAWFGGLVLVGIGIQQTANGGFAAVLHMFGLNVGSGLGTFPASDNPGLLPGLNLNVGQFAPDALAQGVTVSPPPGITGVQGPPPGVSSTVVNPVGDATGIFPTLEPGGTITSNVTTNGLPPSRNLA